MTSNPNINEDSPLLHSIIGLIDSTRYRVATTVNQELTQLFWHIGKAINEELLQNSRADYGEKIIEKLSIRLRHLYGSGFNKRNLHSFTKLNVIYPVVEIVHTLCAKLSWSHIRFLI